MDLYEIFQQQGLAIDDFLGKYANDGEQSRWERAMNDCRLNETQRARVSAFVREIKVLCMAGAWCGDCIEQCPILVRIAEQSPLIELRFVDRDASDELKNALQICGAARVPQVIFFSEDGYEVSRFGDRTLAKYRSMAQSLDGAACAIGGLAVDDPITQAVISQWLDEFERVHWILRLSPRLRQVHAD